MQKTQGMNLLQLHSPKGTLVETGEAVMWPLLSVHNFEPLFLFGFFLSIIMFCPMRKCHPNDLFRSPSNSYMISVLAGKAPRG